MDSPDLTVVLFSRRRGRLRDFTLRSLLADGIQADSVVIKQYSERPFDCTDIPSRFIAFMNEGDLWFKGKSEAMERTLKDAPACSHLLYPVQYFDVPIKALAKRQSFPSDNPYYASALAFRSEMLDKVSFHLKNNRVYADTGRQIIRLLPEVYGTACPEPNIGLLPRVRKACQARRKRPGLSLESIRDYFKGRRCFVIGNGPSLKDTDLSRLKGEVSFASNSFNLLFPQLDWRPDVYACVDTLVLPDRAQELGDLAQQCPSTRLFLPLFLGDDQLEKFKWWTPDIVPPRENIYYFVDRSAPRKSAIGRRLGRCLYRTPTVTGTLLQLAVLAGCSPIYLIGCDTNYVLPDEATVEPAAVGNAPARVTLKTDSDPNHFSPEYFGRERPWHMPRVELMQAYYTRFRQQIDPKGKRIFNATPGGALEAFPRVGFNSLW